MSGTEGRTGTRSVSIDALLDADLRLSATSGHVVRIDDVDAPALLDVLDRRGVNPIVRADRVDTGWREAVEAFLEASLLRGSVSSNSGLDWRGASPGEFVVHLLAASRRRPFVLVVPEPTERTARQLVEAAESDVAGHGVLLVVIGCATPDRSPRRSGPARPDSGRRLLDRSDLVPLVAVSEVPLPLTRLARLLDEDWADVDELVEEAIHRGVLARVQGRRSTVTMGSPARRRDVRDSLTKDERSRHHRALAAELVGLTHEDGASGLLVADAIAAGRHAIAAATDMEFTLGVCRRAITQCTRSGELEAAIDLIDQLTTSPLPVEEKVDLWCRKAHLHGRLGESKACAQAQTAALDAARDHPGLLARVRAEVAATSRTATVTPDELAEIESMLDDRLDLPPHVQALLLVRWAELVFLSDSRAARKALESALEVARDDDDDDVFAFVCETSVQLLPALDLLEPSDLKRLNGSGPGRAVLHSRLIRECLRTGTRSDLDTLVHQYAAVLRDHPVAAWDSHVHVYKAVQALNDMDPDQFRRSLSAIVDVDRRVGSLEARGRYALSILWGLFTGELDMTQLDDLPVPLEGGIRDLFDLSQSVVRLVSGDLEAFQDVMDHLSDLPVVEPDDWVAPTWWPFLCLSAAAVGNRDLAAAVVGRVAGPPDSWVLFGASHPAGPVGFYVAEAERLCGRMRSAQAACDAGLEAARRMRAMGWTAWCSLQKANLLHLDGDRHGAVPFAESALAIGRRLGLQPVVDQANALLVSLRAVLSGPEADVLRLVAEGMSNKQIARHRGVSVKRIENILTSAYRRLGVSNRTQAVRALLAQDALAAAGATRPTEPTH